MAVQIPFKTYNGHFIKNTIEVPSNGLCLLIESFDKFEKYFGMASMTVPMKYVTENLFNGNCVLAVLKNYLGDPVVHSVACEGHRLEMTYSIDRIETPGWVAHTPVIVSIPRHFVGYPRCTDFVFLKQEEMFSINSAKNETADTDSGQINLGAWGEYRLVNKDASDVFYNAMKQFLGVQYVPVLYKVQVVAGFKYCFLCTSKVQHPDAKWGMSIVSVYKSPSGEVKTTGIRNIPIPSGENVEKFVAQMQQGNKK